MAFLDFKDLIASTAKARGYSPAFLAAQAHQESGFNPRAVSKAGAMGLMQFMPATWAEWGQGQDPFDPAASLDAGVRYMQSLLNRYRGAEDPQALALAAYNGGMRRVDDAIKATGRTDWNGIVAHLPTESQAYSPLILNREIFYKTIFITGLAAPALALIGLLVVLVLRRVMA